MTESISQSQEIASVDIKIGGKTNKLVLTEGFVGIHDKGGIFHDATAIIPLGAIDYIFHGWRRYKFLLYLGILILLVGLLMMWQKITGGSAVSISGVILLLVFFFWRPHVILVRSNREALGGIPVLTSEAKNFVAVLADTIGKAG